jgi:hypothetical protein
VGGNVIYTQPLNLTRYGLTSAVGEGRGQGVIRSPEGARPSRIRIISVASFALVLLQIFRRANCQLWLRRALQAQPEVFAVTTKEPKHG